MQRNRTTMWAAALIAAAIPGLRAQEHVVRVTPAELTLAVGQKAQLKAEVVDVGGRPVDDAQVFFFSRARRAVSVSREGELLARKPGTHTVIARARIGGKRGPQATVTVTVPQPTPAKVALRGAPKQLYAGTTVRVQGEVLDENDIVRDDLSVALASSDAGIASIDAFGQVTAVAPGAFTLSGTGGGLTTESKIQVLANPVRKIDLTAAVQTARTGDVIRFRATGLDGNGAATDVPVHYSFYAAPDDTLGNAATGQIQQDGRFVAETPGLYTIVATCGDVTARTTVRCSQRFPQKKKLVKVGHGLVADAHTSDLWVWEGIDGRDYCVTGTWGANGDALFWDVTDPSRIEQIAKITVDARTVNDVKVSEDGTLCVISREGASNRKNGIVAIDVRDPRNPKIVSEFNDELTGGVHNLFIDQGHVYALSAGRRYDVLNFQNANAPSRVGTFQLFEPGASIHDVWVTDGVAFSSNWRYGVRLVDVGNGIAGGSPSNPVEFAKYAYPSGWNHAAFPFTSPDTGKFYVFAGDEAFPYGLNVENDPTYPRGWIHIIDFSNLKNPQEVARYEVPEAGTHNLWIDGTTLYVAYYNGGLRVVDISGDLMGDLYRQGREIAWFLPTHPKGKVANAPMVWGPQPHKGHIFFSDWNSGLWAVKLVDDKGRRR